MLQFDLIGSIDLRRDDGEELSQLLRQPKRLALLAYLVTPSPGSWHRRDTLLGVFWPELDTSHARTALRNALYVLRQALGEGVVLTRGDEEVAIDPARLRTDLDQLRSALGAMRCDEALGRYKGDLLAGLFLGDSPTFDSWLEAQRTRLRAEVTRLAIREVDTLQESGKTSDAIRIATRVFEINPDETSLRRVMLLLEAQGERAGGLAVYERFTEWLHKELGAEPSAETRAIAERLRTATAGARETREGRRENRSDPIVITVTSPQERRRTRALVIGSVVMVLVVLLAGFVVRVLSPWHPNSIGRDSKVTNDEGLQIEVAISPDGKTLAFAMGDPGSLKIWIHPLHGGERYPLTPDSTPFELVPRWSPQNDRILYLSGNDAWVSSAQVGSKAHRVVLGLDADRSVRSASWSPGGDSVLYVLDSVLQVTPLDGVGSRVIGRGGQLHSCVWSPNGKWIACVTGNWVGFTRGPLFGNRGQSGILLFPAKGGEAIRFTDTDHQYESPAWSEDGRELWVLSDRDGIPGQVYSIPVGSDGQPGRPERIGIEAEWISLGANRLAYSDYDRSTNVWSLPIPASDPAVPTTADEATQVTKGHHIIEVATVSPDLTWLVFDANDNASSDIYRLPLADLSAKPQRLTDDRRPEFVGTISADGRFLGYHLWDRAKRRLNVKRLSDGKIFEPWPDSMDQGTLRFSPDGRSIAGWAHETESGSIFVLHRTSDTTWSAPAWRLTNALLPYWTPDGQNILYLTLDGRIMEIPADSGPSRQLYAPKPNSNDPVATNVILEKDSEVMWFIGQTPDGKGGIWRMPVGGGPYRQVVSLTTKHRTTYGPVFASDGKRLYFVIDERRANAHWTELIRK